MPLYLRLHQRTYEESLPYSRHNNAIHNHTDIVNVNVNVNDIVMRAVPHTLPSDYELIERLCERR